MIETVFYILVDGSFGRFLLTFSVVTATSKVADGNVITISTGSLFTK